jgi:hypothetical protein
MRRPPRSRNDLWFLLGDEAAFFSFAKGIKAVTRIEGVGDAIRLHVRSRPSGASLHDLAGLFRRYGIDMRELDALRTSTLRKGAGIRPLQRTGLRPAAERLYRSADKRRSFTRLGATLKYLSGEDVVAGDIVRVTLQARPVEAKVAFVLIPGSAEALEWNAPEGGIMINSEATGWVLWRSADEDMTFIGRDP